MGSMGLQLPPPPPEVSEAMGHLEYTDGTLNNQHMRCSSFICVRRSCDVATASHMSSFDGEQMVSLNSDIPRAKPRTVHIKFHIPRTKTRSFWHNFRTRREHPILALEKRDDSDRALIDAARRISKDSLAPFPD